MYPKLILLLLIAFTSVLRGQEYNPALMEKMEQSLRVPGDSFRLDLDYMICCQNPVCDFNLLIYKTLVHFLVENPDARIEIASYTDCQGNDGYNLELSQRRANHIQDFLIENDIPLNQIRAIGYGETRPVITCLCTGKSKQPCREVDHQINRRVVLRLID